jgi:hypothetical protein
MTEMVYDGSLDGLFTILDKVCGGMPLPGRIRQASTTDYTPLQGDLFGPAGDAPPSEEDKTCRWNSGGAAKELYSVSVNAYENFVQGWMSEFPIAVELIRFAWKVISGARAAGRNRQGGIKSPEARLAAGRAAADRGDPAVAATLTAAYKVCRETDRLQGLLRFAPDSRGIYTARCAPDHFVLPGLAEHFFQRFGDTPWTIIDEKRALALVCPADGEPRLVQGSALPETGRVLDAPWADLWRSYHRAINNETRKNPVLQRQFMPGRYWKYLTEI